MPDSPAAVAKRRFSGTYRTVAPAETVARVRPYFSEAGITRVANVTGLDRLGIPVVMVTRPNWCGDRGDPTEGVRWTTTVR